MARLLALALFALVLIAPASAQDVAIGDNVVLRATSPLGVPLHREARSSLFGRAPDGATGSVLDLAQDGRWLKLQLVDGRTGWVVSRYAAAQTASGPTTPAVSPASADEAAVFGSREQCEQVVRAGGRMAPHRTEALRVATWNIRWFPVGDPRETGQETDLAWLACALAWLNPDIVALQEILDTRQADVAWASVIDGLEAFVGGDWRVDLHDCAGEQAQHVGFLWNTARLALTNPRDLWQLNGAAAGPGAPCANNLRPGRGAYVRALDGGADFHIVAVHSDSGTSPRDFDHRQTALRRLDDLFAALGQDVPDADVIVLGDFNTMGAEGRLGPAEEIALFEQTVRTEMPGYRALLPALQCTEYFNGQCNALDHIVVTQAMREAGVAEAHVTGYCAVAGGRPIDPDAMPAVYARLSDHCPVVVEVQNLDLD